MPRISTEPSYADDMCHLAVNKDKVFKDSWRMGAAILICTIFMVGEVVGGIYAHSLSILTDAAHMMSDVSAFAISLFAGLYALRQSQTSHTYGYHRAEVLGSLVSILIIWVVTGVLLYEAVQRIITPQDVDGRLMFILAAAGIVVNLFVMAIFGHGHSHAGHDHGHSHGSEKKAKAVNPAKASEDGEQIACGSSSPHQHSHDGAVAPAPKTCSNGHDHAGHDHAAHDHSGHEHAGHNHVHDNKEHKEHVHKHKEEKHTPAHMHDHPPGTACGSKAEHKHSEHTHGSALATETTLIAINGSVIIEVAAPAAHSHDHGSHDHSAHDHAGHNHDHEDDDHEGHDHESHGGGGCGHGHESMGVRAAFIHAVGDTVQSLGVCIAGVIIWIRPEWRIVDPICTFLFGFLVLLTTKGVLRDITDIIMERVPRNVDIDALFSRMNDVAGVDKIHDLHVWCLKPGVVLLSAHVVLSEEAGHELVLKKLTQRAKAAGIQHSTIMIVSAGHSCPCEPPNPLEVPLLA